MSEFEWVGDSRKDQYHQWIQYQSQEYLDTKSRAIRWAGLPFGTLTLSSLIWLIQVYSPILSLPPKTYSVDIDSEKINRYCENLAFSNTSLKFNLGQESNLMALVLGVFAILLLIEIASHLMLIITTEIQKPEIGKNPDFWELKVKYEENKEALSKCRDLKNFIRNNTFLLVIPTLLSIYIAFVTSGRAFLPSIYSPGIQILVLDALAIVFASMVVVRLLFRISEILDGEYGVFNGIVIQYSSHDLDSAEKLINLYRSGNIFGTAILMTHLFFSPLPLYLVKVFRFWYEFVYIGPC